MFLEYSKVRYRKKTKANSVCIRYFHRITIWLEICSAQSITRPGDDDNILAPLHRTVNPRNTPVFLELLYYQVSETVSVAVDLKERIVLLLVTFVPRKRL